MLAMGMMPVRLLSVALSGGWAPCQHVHSLCGRWALLTGRWLVKGLLQVPFTDSKFCVYMCVCVFVKGLPQMPLMASGQASPKSNNYKTRICLNWHKTGHCQYGARCNFAHGHMELRVGMEKVRERPCVRAVAVRPLVSGGWKVS